MGNRSNNFFFKRKGNKLEQHERRWKSYGARSRIPLPPAEGDRSGLQSSSKVTTINQPWPLWPLVQISLQGWASEISRWAKNSKGRIDNAIWISSRWTCLPLLLPTSFPLPNTTKQPVKGIFRVSCSVQKRRDWLFNFLPTMAPPYEGATLMAVSKIVTLNLPRICVFLLCQLLTSYENIVEPLVRRNKQLDVAIETWRMVSLTWVERKEDDHL